MSEGGKRLNDAITEKVRRVLDNMDSPTNLYIRIDVGAGEIPMIEYRIRENIVLEEGTVLYE